MAQGAKKGAPERDIEFFVVKKGIHQRIEQIIKLFVNRGFLTMGSSASPIVVVLQFSAGSRWYGRNSRPLASFPNRPRRRRRPRSRPFPSGTSETPAVCFSLFLLSYVQPGNRPQSVIDHEDDDDEDDYKDEED